MSMHRKAILSKLKIRQWDGFIKDIKVANDVDLQYHTKGSAGNYNKRLFSKGVLQPIQRVANKLRADHNNLTMPYSYEGVGILTKDIYFEYCAMVRAHTDTFDTAVINFVTQYPIHKANRAAELGDLYNPKDYPSQDELREKFSIATKFAPVPNENHFDGEFDEDDIAEIRENFAADMRDTQQEAVDALYQRVNKTLTHLHDKLQDPESVFRDSTVGNMHGLIELLPKLNIFDDARLERVHQEMVEQLGATTPEELRMNMSLRRKTVTSAFDIIGLLNGDEVNDN
jgi:hypothetical protein